VSEDTTSLAIVARRGANARAVAWTKKMANFGSSIFFSGTPLVY